MSSPVREELHAQNRINSRGLQDLAEPEPRSVTGPGGTGKGRKGSSLGWTSLLQPKVASHLLCPQPWLFAKGKGGRKEGGRGRGGRKKEKEEGREGGGRKGRREEKGGERGEREKFEVPKTCFSRRQL